MENYCSRKRRKGGERERERERGSLPWFFFIGKGQEDVTVVESMNGSTTILVRIFVGDKNFEEKILRRRDELQPVRIISAHS